MKKERLLLVLLDTVMFFIASSLLFYLKFNSGIFDSIIHFPVKQLIINSSILTTYWLLLFYLREMYKSFYSKNIIEIFSEVLFSGVIGILILFVIFSFSDASLDLIRVGLYIYLGLTVALCGFSRVIFKVIQVKLLQKGYGKRNTLIIGYNKESKRIITEYHKGNLIGLNIIGFIDDKHLDKEYMNVKVLGSIKELEKKIKETKTAEVIISLNRSNDVEINKVIFFAKGARVDFKILPSLTDIISGHVKSCQVLGFPLMNLFPEIQTPLQRLIKRVFDILISITILICALPVMIACAIIIKLESPGEIIFRQKRVGKDFKEFTLFKFRSMVKNAEAKTGAVWAKKNDARITKFGNFMRKTRLDELPQLINVIKGEMSFVGPRPERKVFIDQFIIDIPYYYKRLTVKPGLTGWAQVKHKYDESFDDVKDKTKFDLFYIENMSLKLDLIILFNTIGVVLNKKGQ